MVVRRGSTVLEIDKLISAQKSVVADAPPSATRAETVAYPWLTMGRSQFDITKLSVFEFVPGFNLKFVNCLIGG